MPFIQCTKKLLDELRISNEETGIILDTPSLLGNWHANLIRIERRKCVLFTNNATLFSFLVPKLIKVDFQNLKSVFMKQLISNLIYEGLEKYVDSVLWECQFNLYFKKTSDRRVLGSMNDMVNLIQMYLGQDGGLERMNILELNKGINRTPFKANKFHSPIESLRQALTGGVSL
jgi:hypothetical protein